MVWRCGFVHYEVMNIIKAVAAVIAVLLVLKVIAEVLSFVFSGWFILAAIAVWYFFFRNGASGAEHAARLQDTLRK